MAIWFKGRRGTPYGERFYELKEPSSYGPMFPKGWDSFLENYESSGIYLYVSCSRVPEWVQVRNTENSFINFTNPYPEYIYPTFSYRQELFPKALGELERMLEKL